MVPTMWASMVTSEEIDRFDLGSLRLLLSGGSPLLTHTKDAILRRFPKAGLNEFYGGTEVGLVTNLSPEDQRRKVRSVGRPVIGMFVELRDEQGNVVPQGRGRGNSHRRRNDHPGIFQQSGGDGRRKTRRLLHTGRHGPIRRGGLPLHRRSQEGHDHQRRREHIPQRHRGNPLQASRCRNGRRGRRSRSEVGRNRRRGRQIEAGQFRRPGRTHRALQDIPVQLQGSEEDRFPRPDADVLLRQNTSARRQKILLGTLWK